MQPVADSKGAATETAQWLNTPRVVVGVVLLRHGLQVRQAGGWVVDTAGGRTIPAKVAP
jgi:hypothetical protein